VQEGKLLRIFIGEKDRHEGLPLYEWIVRRAHERAIAGATVLRAMEGFGAHHRLHKANILRLSGDLPIVVEIVDTSEKIEGFLAEIDSALRDALVTLEKVQMRFGEGLRKEGT
jgi:PII-like signaling protein